MTLEAIRYSDGKLQILDQLLLPFESKYVDIQQVDDAWKAIKDMQVRGAPAIAVVGCLSLAVELHSHKDDFKSKDELENMVNQRMEYLVSARPTAVNIGKSAIIIKQLVSDLANQKDVSVAQMKEKIIKHLEEMLENDVKDNKSIGEHGATHILQNCTQKPLRILTHCNTGSLATVAYGTALGVVRSLFLKGELDHVYCTETRPYNQGARLTAYELVYEKIPSTLICDSAVGWAMKNKGLSAVIVGADRVAANGDTANKIGTYQLAVLASQHSIPFYVAAPVSSIDWNVLNGSEITVEERTTEEITHMKGQRIAAEGIHCWNPAFDITPASLITGGIITEKGVVAPHQLNTII